MATYTAADGHSLHYWDMGTGPVCILVHGFGMPAFLWLPFITPLLGKYRFILPDLRGFGASHKVPVGHESVFTQYAHDLHGLIEHLDVESPALVGFSMGACTAMEYQRLYGFDRIRSYLQIDQAMRLTNDESYLSGLFGADQATRMASLKQMMEDFESLGRERRFFSLPAVMRRRFWKQFSLFGASAFANPFLKYFAEMGRHEFLVRFVAPVSNWPVYLDCIRTFVGNPHDYRETMAQQAGEKPVWFFVGDESALYPAEGQLAAKEYIKHSKVVRFKGAGHALMFDSPVRFVRKLNQFLSSTAAH